MSHDESIANLGIQLRRLRIVVAVLAIATASSLFFALRPREQAREIVLRDGEQVLALAPGEIYLGDGVSSFQVRLHSEPNSQYAMMTLTNRLNQAQLEASSHDAALSLSAHDLDNDSHGDSVEVRAEPRRATTPLDRHRQQGLTDAIAVNLDGQQLHAVLAPTPAPTPILTPVPTPPAPTP